MLCLLVCYRTSISSQKGNFEQPLAFSVKLQYMSLFRYEIPDEFFSRERNADEQELLIKKAGRFHGSDLQKVLKQFY